jgi:hypothetical protein
VLVFLLSACLVVWRRPDALFYPQFFAEDGATWFREAYIFGWLPSLLVPHSGYYQTVSRLGAALALLVPFRFAPLIMNLAGIAFQVLPVNFLLSARCSNWAPLPARALMAFLYLALPNTAELDANLDEAQWHLAVLACLVVLARPASNAWWRVFDLLVVLLSGLTGPFCLVLLPIAAVYWYAKRERWTLALLAATALPAVVQLYALFTTGGTRPHTGLGATVELFIQILAGQVYLAAILGRGGFQVSQQFPLLVVAALGGSLILAWCLWKARLEWKLFITFCLLVFAASLVTSTVTDNLPQWPIMREAEGIRYWFPPILAFVWALAWCATVNANGVFRFVGVAGLALGCFGIVQDWKYPPYTDHHFPQYAAQFAAAPPGTMIAIPISHGWTLRLVKKGASCRAVPIGSIDRPRPDASFGPSLAVGGWALASEHIRMVSIDIDRTRIGSVTPFLPRPDVDAIYPQSPDKYKGWRITVDTSKVTPGAHELEVRALTSAGCEADIVRVPIKRVP